MTTVRKVTLSAAALLLVQTNLALAAGSGMPWEAPLTQILESIEGPVARIVAVIVIITTGLSLAYNLAVMLFGGFAQFIVTWLIHVTGDPYAAAYYVMFGACAGFCAACFIRPAEHVPP